MKGAMAGCRMTSLVDHHFEGRIELGAEQTLREHLPGCESCRLRYRRFLLYEKLAKPEGAREERLASSLGIRSPAFNRWRGLRGLAAVASCLVIIQAVVGRIQTGNDDEFQARGQSSGGGSLAPGPSLQLYRLVEGRSQKLDGAIRPGQALAFTYTNPLSRRFLMVFATDEHQRVYWFAPAWTDASQTPSAIPIAPGPEPREHPLATSHDFAGVHLRLHAFFLDTPLTVRQMEAALTKAGDPGLPAFSGDHVVVPVEVQP